MNPHVRQMCDRLVKADWLDNVTERSESEMNWRWIRGKTPAENGQFKLMLFAKLYRELLRGGQMSQEELDLIVGMGATLAVKEGWDMN